MKKSKVFKADKGTRDFRAKGVQSYIIFGNSSPVTVPKSAKHVQFVCTVKKQLNSLLVADSPFHIMRQDFVDNKLPKKEKYFHVVYW